MTKKKMNNKGFTLVELIVVLVILAILAAILVPTLLGYIDKAKSEKDYSTAQSIRVAYQSAIADAYAKKQADEDLNVSEALVWQLVGAAQVDGVYKLDGVPVSYSNVTLSTDGTYQILTMQVTINGHDYYLSNNEWSAEAPAAASTGGEGEGN